MKLRSVLATPMVVAVVALVGCGTSSGGGGGGNVTLRLGYFPNVTHATPIVGLEQGIFKKDLGSGVSLSTQTFTSGSPESEALLDGSLDAGYMGPSSALTAFSKSHGAVVIISGAASGGAELVVKRSITTVSQLKGATIASPQLGNTQDVSLRYYLSQHGLSAPANGGGDVTVLPESNSLIVTGFESGQIDGAWVPEPYASRLVLQGGGHVLVDERSLWPNGQFSTTVLVVNKSYLDANPTVIANLLKAQVATTAWLQANPTRAQSIVNAAIASLTQTSPLPPATIARAWSEMTFTNDPLATSVIEAAAHARAVGFSISSDLSGLFDLSPLNTALSAAGQSTMAPTP